MPTSFDVAALVCRSIPEICQQHVQGTKNGSVFLCDNRWKALWSRLSNQSCTLTFVSLSILRVFQCFQQDGVGLFSPPRAYLLLCGLSCLRECTWYDDVRTVSTLHLEVLPGTPARQDRPSQQQQRKQRPRCRCRLLTVDHRSHRGVACAGNKYGVFCDDVH